MTITRHKKLDPKLWLNNEHIKPDVRDMLLAISWNLIDFIRNRYALNIHNSDIKDIIMFGSTANYFYTKKSDIDICIVMDITALEQQYPNMNIMKMLKLYYYDWAMVHTCSIRGRKIDLNFEIYGAPQFNGRYRTGANYSIMHDDWIFKPIIIPRQELRDIVHQGNTIYKQIIHDYPPLGKSYFSWKHRGDTRAFPGFRPRKRLRQH